MTLLEIEPALQGLPLGSIGYWPRVGSTNDLAARWADKGVPDMSLVIAGEQTQGRGRAGRRWYTPPGCALAFSVILRPESLGRGENLALVSALGALAVCDALREGFQLPAEIKWPNDVLVRERKLAGVLAEAQWLGELPTALILGIGINVAPAAVPSPAELDYPATCVDTERGVSTDRWLLLRHTLEKLLFWRARFSTSAFIQAWEQRLAFRGERVRLYVGARASLEGTLLGLAPDGGLRLRTPTGEERVLHSAEASLRPFSKR